MLSNTWIKSAESTGNFGTSGTSLFSEDKNSSPKGNFSSPIHHVRIRPYEGMTQSGVIQQAPVVKISHSESESPVHASSPRSPTTRAKEEKRKKKKKKKKKSSNLPSRSSGFGGPENAMLKRSRKESREAPEFGGHNARTRTKRDPSAERLSIQEPPTEEVIDLTDTVENDIFESCYHRENVTSGGKREYSTPEGVDREWMMNVEQTREAVLRAAEESRRLADELRNSRKDRERFNRVTKVDQ